MLILCVIYSICALGLTIMYMVKDYGIQFLIVLIINVIAIPIVITCFILELKNKRRK